jgi:hypothetical protein
MARKRTVYDKIRGERYERYSRLAGDGASHWIQLTPHETPLRFLDPATVTPSPESVEQHEKTLSEIAARKR